MSNIFFKLQFAINTNISDAILCLARHLNPHSSNKNNFVNFQINDHENFVKFINQHQTGIAKLLSYH